MSKSKNQSNKFNDIKLSDGVLRKVDSFKAIVSQGKQRKILDKNSHKKLVHKKYDDGHNTKDHITLFRVKDKKSLPPKEIKEHTVHGPEWTPPSSVGFVMGALSKGYRVWSATEYTKDNICGKDSEEIAILARESMATMMFGWIAREPQKNEKYGKTDRGPHVVFTPPSSPRAFLDVEDKVARILDVNAKWQHMPMSLEKLTRLSSPISKPLSDFLKKTQLPRENFHDSLVRMVMKNELSIEEMSSAPVELLLDEEVVLLLSDKTLYFQELVAIYDEFIDASESVIGEFSFSELYNLILNNRGELADLLFELKLSINDVIALYNQDPEMFCAVANDNAIKFFNEYSSDCDITRMLEIYKNNQSLFYALINDPDELLQDISVEDFINGYEEEQERINRISDDDLYKDDYDPYDILRNRVNEDGCPDELLPRNSWSDSEYSNSEYDNSTSNSDGNYSESDYCNSEIDEFDNIDISGRDINDIYDY